MKKKKLQLTVLLPWGPSLFFLAVSFYLTPQMGCCVTCPWSLRRMTFRAKAGRAAGPLCHWAEAPARQHRTVPIWKKPKKQRKTPKTKQNTALLYNFLSTLHCIECILPKYLFIYLFIFVILELGEVNDIYLFKQLQSYEVSARVEVFGGL